MRRALRELERAQRWMLRQMGLAELDCGKAKGRCGLCLECHMRASRSVQEHREQLAAEIDQVRAAAQIAEKAAAEVPVLRERLRATEDVLRREHSLANDAQAVSLKLERAEKQLAEAQADAEHYRRGVANWLAKAKGQGRKCGGCRGCGDDSLMNGNFCVGAGWIASKEILAKVGVAPIALDPDPRTGRPGGADLLGEPGPGFPLFVEVQAHERRSPDGRGWWEGYNSKTKEYHRGVFVVEGGKVFEFRCDDDSTHVDAYCAASWTFKAVPPPPPAAPEVNVAERAARLTQVIEGIKRSEELQADLDAAAQQVRTADRAPNLRRHQRAKASDPCGRCGATAEEIAAGKPCPARKGPA